MKKYLFMAVAAIAVLSGCSSDNDPIMGETGKEALTFTASMEGVATTRATYNDTKKCASWEEGDQISINGKTYNAQSAGTTTTFKADDEDATGPYNAYFPADLYDGTTATLPANINEKWADGKFNMPMYAYSTTTELAFKNLCGVLKVTVKNNQMESVKSIKVSSSNCATSGAFTVNTDNSADLTTPDVPANTVTVTYTVSVTTDATGKVFYVAIPPQTYKNLKIELSADGTNYTKSMTTKKDVDILVERNKIYNITFQDNAPTTGTAKRNGDIDVRWVQLWENGPKFAEYNVGATSATDYGGYYAWGGSQDKVDDHNTGTVDLSPTSDPITDTATKLWGSNWRMPTSDELGKKENDQYIDGLLGKCTCVWTTNYNNTGVNGLLCTGKGDYASNSVFLPAAGYRFDGYVRGQGEGGSYWSSTPGDSRQAYYLNFYSESQDVLNYPRDQGVSVRAVLNETSLPDGALSGVFSVSGSKQVYFSGGNLVATINASGTPTAWKFATHQYDYIGKGGANMTIGKAAGDVDLFGWSTASTTYGISTSTTNTDYSGDFVDWGKAYCEKNSITPDNTWRTLSKDEWTYLFNTRIVNGGTGEGKSYQRATINSDAGGGVYGMILYPDNYTGTAKTSYTSTEWESLENAGCVFLPAAGSREGSSVPDVNGGYYWSSTGISTSCAYYVFFDSDDVIPDIDGFIPVDDDYAARYYGSSVRLITESK